MTQRGTRAEGSIGGTEAPLAGILRLAQRLCGADACAIWQGNPANGEWWVAEDLGLSPGYPRVIPQYPGPLPGEVLHFEDVREAPLLAGRTAAYETEGIRSLIAVPLAIRGEHTATVTCYFRQRRTLNPAEIEALTELAELASRAITWERLNEEQQGLRMLAEQAERRSSFLAEASRILGSSLDYEVTLRHVAEMAVPDLADWCTVQLKAGEGPPRLVAVAHVDPGKVEWARSVQDRLPYDPDAPAGLARVLRTGESELYPHIPDELLIRSARSPEHLALLRELGLTSAVIVPLVARQEVLGAVTLMSAESGVHYDQKTLEVAEDLARRAATAIDHARLFQEAQELQKQAIRLAAIVESSDDAIVSKDLNGVIQSWNQGAERIFGYTEEEIVGRPIHILIPPERAEEEPAILERLRRGERVDHFETVRVRKDGERIDISVTISPIHDGTGRIIGASKIARDVTLQKILQRELHARVEALALADRRKDEFLAMLAHELRNPLSPVVTAAAILRAAAPDNPTVMRQQAVIERQISHMARLLDDLLDVSRITRGKVTLRLEETDLAEIVRRTVETCKVAVEERKHTLTTSVPRQPMPLKGDPVRLEQVVSNLLLNAAKYTDPGGCISVTLGQEGPEARLAVRDTGVGIEPELLSSVFDLFFQADRGLDRSQGGLGIGLTMVRSLVELHGGTVEAFSEGPGRGSEFVVRLPLLPCLGQPGHPSVLAGEGATPGRPVH
jgi:PAS domain S-box-containing protein